MKQFKHCKESQQNINTTASRQYHSSSIYQQFGWNDVQAASQSSKGTYGCGIWQA